MNQFVTGDQNALAMNPMAEDFAPAIIDGVDRLDSTAQAVTGFGEGVQD